MSDAQTETVVDEVKPEQDPLERMREQGKSPELAATLAWLIPGAGHLYAGYPIKGGLSLVMVLGLFVWGILLSGGDCVSLDRTRGHPYAFVAEVGAGGPTLLALAHSYDKLPGFPNPPMSDSDYQESAYVSRLPDIDTGLLFCELAGLLNLLLVYDAMRGVPGAVTRRAEERRMRRRMDDLRQELAKGNAEETPAAEEAPATEEPATEEPASEEPPSETAGGEGPGAAS